MYIKQYFLHVKLWLILVTLLFGAVSSANGGGIIFDDIVPDAESGIVYERIKSHRNTRAVAIRMRNAITWGTLPFAPINPRGATGVTLFDYDNDGDLDIYVTNGPGHDNSLFENRLEENGTLTFADTAELAGVCLQEFDSIGAVAGDIDNDGDKDLFVVGNKHYTLFQNNGNGTFSDITKASGISNPGFLSQSATMGDINGDGLIDIFIANATNYNHQRGLMMTPFTFAQPNLLFINNGNNTFVDASLTSGIQTHIGFPDGKENASAITHACAFVDYDMDGDVDLFVADDQGGISSSSDGGVDHGLIHLFKNSGSGSFKDVADVAGIAIPGGWMGLSFGDFNGDGIIDFFATNLGNYIEKYVTSNSPMVDFPSTSRSSIWFLGSPNGTFTDAGFGTIEPTAFGWGTSCLDYDNDGDTDIVYHGGLDFCVIIDASNPGILLENDGLANFIPDMQAFTGSTNHTRRDVKAVAVGDINNDGFVDIVTVSNFDIDKSAPLELYPPIGGILDQTAFFIPVFNLTDKPMVLLRNEEFKESHLKNGSISVELSSANNGNGWVAIDVMGTIGITADGKVNRDGIGAVVTFTPENGAAVIKPIIAGSSHASQDSLSAHFGLGTELTGTIDILWPGGVRNRLHNVKNGTRLLFPEIPVSINDPTLSAEKYNERVALILEELVQNEIITRDNADWFLTSAKLAFSEEHI